MSSVQYFTSYFGQAKNLGAANIVPICIALRAPRWWRGLRYDPLAPTPYILSLKDKPDLYTEQFTAHLARLNSHQVLKDLNSMARGEPWALLCYEKPGEFCHRNLVATWLATHERHINITEFNKSIHTV